MVRLHAAYRLMNLPPQRGEGVTLPPAQPPGPLQQRASTSISLARKSPMGQASESGMSWPSHWPEAPARPARCAQSSVSSAAATVRIIAGLSTAWGRRHAPVRKPGEERLVGRDGANRDTGGSNRQLPVRPRPSSCSAAARLSPRLLR